MWASTYVYANFFTFANNSLTENFIFVQCQVFFWTLACKFSDISQENICRMFQFWEKFLKLQALDQLFDSVCSVSHMFSWKPSTILLGAIFHTYGGCFCWFWNKIWKNNTPAFCENNQNVNWAFPLGA